MDKVFATLRTFGVLLGIWVILAVVGIVAGVVPLGLAPPEAGSRLSDAAGEGGEAEGAPDSSAPDSDEAEAERAAADAVDAPAADEASAAARVESSAGGPAAGGPAADGPAADGPAAGGPAADHGVGTRYAVCRAPRAAPSLAVAELYGGGAPEVVVGCADGWQVLGIGPRGPARIARFVAPAPPEGQRARMGRAVAGDVDADGAADLVLPLAFESETGATRGGALFWVPASPFGGIREPVSLAPIAAFDAAVGALDGAEGADVAAVNRANALAQLPSELWAFTGGAAPARLAALPVGVDGAAVAIGDLDRDGHADLVGLSAGRVDLRFGDGAGGFDREHTLVLQGAREIALGDLDEDGARDLVVLGEGIRWIRAGALDGMEPRGLDGVPSNLRGLQVLDVDGDGHPDLVGWDHPRLFVLGWRGEVDFLPRSALRLVGGSFGPRRHRVADLDGDGRADDLVLIGTGPADAAPAASAPAASAPGDAEAGATLELLIVHDAIEESELTPADEVRPLPDAPLVLRAPLVAGR